MGAGKVRHYLFSFSWGTKIPSLPLLAAPPSSLPPAPHPLPFPPPGHGSPSTQEALGSCASSLEGSLGLGRAWVLGLRGLALNPPAACRPVHVQSLLAWTEVGKPEPSGVVHSTDRCPLLLQSPSRGCSQHPCPIAQGPLDHHTGPCSHWVLRLPRSESRPDGRPRLRQRIPVMGSSSPAACFLR